MKVSIIIPTRNEELSIERCLNSIYSQTFEDFEVIVVDSSGDSTPKIAQRYDLKLVRQKSGGIAAARNEGIRYATGEIVAFVDADDFISENYLEKNIPPLSRSNVMGVFSKRKHVRPKSLTGKIFAAYISTREGEYTRWPKLWKAEVFNQLSFDENLVVGEDVDFWKRVREKVPSKGWLFERGEGVYYYADLENTLIAHLRKTIWHGSGCPMLLQRDSRVLFDVIAAFFFAFAPFFVFAFFPICITVSLLCMALYASSWPILIAKAITHNSLSSYVLLIPFLLTLRAIGFLTGMSMALAHIITSGIWRNR